MHPLESRNEMIWKSRASLDHRGFRLWGQALGLLYAARFHFAVEETIYIAGTLIVEAGGFAPQTLIGVGVDDRGKGLLHSELRLFFDEQQGEVLHHVEFHLFLFTHRRFRILMARSVPKKYWNVMPRMCDRESYESPSFPMAVFGHVADHRLKRLRVAVVVVLVDEFDASEAAQVVECLLERQSEAMAKLTDEDERPLHFVCHAICHYRFVLIMATKIIIRIKKSKIISIFLSTDLCSAEPTVAGRRVKQFVIRLL